MNFFDVLDCINTKKYVWDDEVEKLYTPYMVNKGFSQFSDTVLYAAEMNQYPDLDKKLQYDFYYYFLPKKKRTGKWEKAIDQSKDQDMVIELFGISRDKSTEYVKTLDVVYPNWREEAVSKLDKGGRSRR
jgi:hypothetical protein